MAVPHKRGAGLIVAAFKRLGVKVLGVIYQAQVTVLERIQNTEAKVERTTP